jgi:peptide-methionine (S)-S-oxide reductase
MDNNNQVAVFGGGCFWCTEAVFQQVRGVNKVTSGYAGGEMPKPTYEQVTSGHTGHAEVIRIEFDPGQIAYQDLLEIFFATHDPTSMNRQGNDVGEQYRSVILYANEAQKTEAEKFIQHLEESQTYNDPVVTQLKPLGEFFPAEDYHQNYYKSNPNQPYCQLVINPKVKKFKEKFASLLKK